MSILHLKPGREKSILRRHPWIFSGAVAHVEGTPGPGETVDILSARGEFLARAAFSPQSQIRARVWSFDPHEAVDEKFLYNRLAAAIALRQALGLEATTDAFRLVHGESDGLPGLIVDRYGDTLVMQVLSAGIEFWREPLAGMLVDLTGAATLYERSDAEVRTLEGLDPSSGAIYGQTPGPILIREHGLEFSVDIASGQKTGFYLDQRDNRLQVKRLSRGRDVLDCFSYTGGFSVSALAGEAKSVTAVDSSQEALDLAIKNVSTNGLPADRFEAVPADVFQILRRYRDAGRSFDLIVLDPPKFAPTAAQVERAARGYKDINLLAFKLLRPGGILVTFSCSGGVNADLFQKIVAGAALDAGVDARVIARLTQAPDHPVALNFPEGEYLKGLVCSRS